MNDKLERLKASVSDLSRLYKTPSLDNSHNTSHSIHSALPLSLAQSSVPCLTGSPAMFLSQAPIQQYYTAEEGFTTQLTAFTRKHFFQVGFMLCLSLSLHPSIQQGAELKGLFTLPC